jgi:hypothetical protein
VDLISAEKRGKKGGKKKGKKKGKRRDRSLLLTSERNIVEERLQRQS